MLSLNLKYRVGKKDKGTEIQVSEGEIHIDGLKLAENNRPLVDAKAIVLKNLAMTMKASESTHLELPAAEIAAQDVHFAQDGQALAEASELTVKNLRIRLDTGAQGMHIEVPSGELGVKNVKVNQEGKPLADVAELSLKNLGLRVDTSEKGAHIEVPSGDLDAKSVRVMQADKPLAEAGTIAARGFGYKPEKQNLTLDTVSLDNVTVKAMAAPADKDLPREIKIRSLRIDKPALSLADHALNVMQIVSSGGQVAAWLAETGDFGLPGLPPPGATAAPEKSGSHSSQTPGWRIKIPRSEERRVGKECRRLCRSRWSPYH
jgi:hypothetical protein